jgi:hypothetical protein
MDSLVKILKILAAVAFFINVLLLIFAATIDSFDLQILSLFNMILLSFSLLHDEK